MKKVLLAILFAVMSTSFASALTVDTGQGTQNVLISDGVAYAIPIKRICGMATMKAGPARYDVDRQGKYVTIGGVVTRITCTKSNGGGGTTTTVQQGTHTGQTAEEVAADLDLPPGSVETIDPGPVVDHDGVIDTNNDGDSDDEADSVTAEGATQSDAQPDEGTQGDTTNGGNDGVDIF